MGQPGPGNTGSSHSEYIGMGGERGEVKHLSTPRKRNQDRDSPSSGERTGKSPNRRKQFRRGCGAALGCSPESYQISVYLKAPGKDNQRG